jgi:alcohol dehydrogenase class IV
VFDHNGSTPAAPAGPVALASFQAPTHLFLGPGAVGRTGEIVQKLGIRRTLVVTDAGVARAGALGHALNSLETAGIATAVFDRVEPQPGIETVREAAALYQSRGCSGIVAVGGGSVIDAARLAGVVVSNPGDLTEYYGVGKVTEPLPPLVAVPTTMGAGSEASNFAVLTDTVNRRRVIVGSQVLAPDFALLDPGLTVTLPPAWVAASALETLSRAVESVTSLLASPFTDALALEAVHLIGANLSDALESPAAGPRSALLYASTLAGMALNYTRLGLGQNMALAAGAYAADPHADALHGQLSAILLPHVMAFNAAEAAPALARVGAALRSAAVSEGGAVDSVEMVRRLIQTAGGPTGLAALGISAENLRPMAESVAENPSVQVVNPRRLSAEEVAALYRAAM